MLLQCVLHQKLVNCGYSHVKSQHSEQVPLHLKQLFLCVGVIRDVHKLVHFRRINLLVFPTQKHQTVTSVSNKFKEKHSSLTQPGARQLFPQAAVFLSGQTCTKGSGPGNWLPSRGFQSTACIPLQPQPASQQGWSSYSWLCRAAFSYSQASACI